MIRFRFDEMYHRGPQLMGAFPLDIRRACQSTSVHTYCWYMSKGQRPSVSTHSLAPTHSYNRYIVYTQGEGGDEESGPSLTSTEQALSCT